MSNQSGWRQWVDQLPSTGILWVGLSGGVDSCVLLHLLTQLPMYAKRLRAIHVNHGISSHAAEWQQHCETLCAQWQVPCVVRQVHCASPANQEAIARQARFEVFDSLVAAGDVLVLAHHADDQAETVLLQLCRGAGLSGLAAMQPLSQRGSYTICRPLLAHTKSWVLAYAKQHALTWVDDDSNDSMIHARNALRHEVLPALKARWPQVVKRLNVVASHCQQAQENLSALAVMDYPTLRAPLSALSLRHLQTLPVARQSNVLWHWLKAHQVRPLHQGMVQRVLNELCGNDVVNGRRISFVSHDVWRYQGSLHLQPLSDQSFPPLDSEWAAGLQSMPWLAGRLVKVQAAAGMRVGAEHNLVVRLRQGGETLRLNGQTKVLKKLLQAWKVPIWQRETLPLIYLEDVLVMVPGYAIHDDYVAPAGEIGIYIQWEPHHVD